MAQTGLADTQIFGAFEAQLERQAVNPVMAPRPPQGCRPSRLRAQFGLHALD